MTVYAFDRYGGDLHTQLGLAKNPTQSLPDRYHVHVCADCHCEFVCTADSEACKVDVHGYGQNFHDCAGCKLDPRPERYWQALAKAVGKVRVGRIAHLALRQHELAWFVTLYISDHADAHRTQTALHEAAARLRDAAKGYEERFVIQVVSIGAVPFCCDADAKAVPSK